MLRPKPPAQPLAVDTADPPRGTLWHRPGVGTETFAHLVPAAFWTASLWARGAGRLSLPATQMAGSLRPGTTGGGQRMQQHEPVRRAPEATRTAAAPAWPRRPFLHLPRAGGGPGRCGVLARYVSYPPWMAVSWLAPAAVPGRLLPGAAGRGPAFGLALTWPWRDYAGKGCREGLVSGDVVSPPFLTCSSRSPVAASMCGPAGGRRYQGLAGS
jgi:hypothetical protein